MTDAGAATGSIPIGPLRITGTYPWVIWALGTATYLAAIIGRTSLSGLGTDVAARFAADSSTLALFAALQLAVYGGMQVPAGLLLDRFGSRTVMIVGLVAMTAGTVWIAFAPDAASAIAARVLTGAGDAMIFPSVLRLLTLWFPVRKVPFLQQVTGQVAQLGQILSVAVLALVVREISWVLGFCALGAVYIVFAVINLCVTRERAVPMHRGDGPKPSQRQLIAQAVREPGTRLAFWVHFVAPFGGTSFVMLWGVPFLTHGEGMSAAQAGLMITVFVLAGVVCAPVLGMISGARPQHRATLALVSVGFQAAVLAVILLWPDEVPMWLVVVWMATLSFGVTASMLSFDIARRFNPLQRLSTATGIVNMGGFVAALIAVYLIGLMLDVQGANPAAYTQPQLRLAFTPLYLLWGIGVTGVIVESRRVRRRARA